MRLDTMGVLHAHINSLIDAWKPSSALTNGLNPGDDGYEEAVEKSRNELRDFWRRKADVAEGEQVHGLRSFNFRVGAQNVTLLLDGENNVIYQDGEL